jgi:hypothetical protein
MRDTVYTRNGFADREAYLADLADRTGVAPADVQLIADLLGPEEDFDGLVSELDNFVFLDDFASCAEPDPATTN